METSDKQENWVKKLSEAEVAHSDAVWEGIEMQLDKDREVKRLRKTVFLYKWLAAACVLLALVSGAYTYFSNDTSKAFDQQLSLNNTSKLDEGEVNDQNGQEALANPSANNAYSEEKQISESISSANQYKHNLKSQSAVSMDAPLFAQENTERVSNNSYLRMASTEYGKSLKEVLPVATGGFNSFNKTTIGNQSGAEEIKSPIVKEDKLLIAEVLPSEETAEKEEKNNKGGEQFWTAVGFAAGTFSNTTPTSPAAAAGALNNSFAGQTAAAESNSPGYTYAVNLMVGTKVSQRWIIQGGMSYITQSSDYTATSVVANPVEQTLKAASINQFEKNADTNVKANILTTSPYTVNNNIQLISFPMQAGFIVMDRKVGFQINSGFSTDLFLQNTITPQVENLEKSTQGRGDDSPYKAFNISGLIGTEVSYRFGDHYRLALSPGLRYPFSSIYKTDLGVKSSPLTFDVAVRFRYILK